ncbi:MAG: diguanylate cyclase [Hyphomicrobiaceae bacterium]|nr:diguanylate cyclase [Hyphomicrobiaceae bacterium]
MVTRGLRLAAQSGCPRDENSAVAGASAWRDVRGARGVLTVILYTSQEQPGPIRMGDIFGEREQHAIEQIDRAVLAHMEWNSRILRCAVLRVSPGDDVLSSDAAHRCGLSHWLEANREFLEDVDPALTAQLERVHEQMHDTVRALCICLMSGSAGDAADLEAFGTSQRALVDDLSHLKTSILARCARLDDLTGLPLRHGLQREFSTRMARAHTQGLRVYCTLFDIDHFKSVNDRYGHATGDMAIKHVAAALRGASRRSDGLFRYGGEEFLVLLDAPGDDAAARSVERLLAAIRRRPLKAEGGLELMLRASAGVIRVELEEQLVDALNRADAALYRAKADGRDRLYFGTRPFPAVGRLAQAR